MGHLMLLSPGYLCIAQKCFISPREITHNRISMAGNSEVDHILKCLLYRGGGRATERVSNFLKVTQVIGEEL